LKVLAFTEKKRKGPREKWTELNMGLLIASVDKEVKAKQAEGKKEDEKKLVSWACKKLATKEPWKSFISGAIGFKDGEALRVKYYKAKKSKISKFIGEVMIIGTRIDHDLWESFLKENVIK